ncbi:MAG: PP2C family serine/threonine-protein phosphatase [Bacteroidota bacterium]
MKAAANNPWVIVSGSVAGRSHVQAEISCQDASGWKALEHGWNLAVVSDGGGYSEAARSASQFCVAEVLTKLPDLVSGQRWFRQGKLPSEETWQALSSKLCAAIRLSLLEKQKLSRAPSQDWAATLIFSLFRVQGACVFHIGDGRAAARSSDGNWFPLMTPFKGELTNHTVFVHMDYWIRIPDAREARIFARNISAVALLTDGCRHAAFKWNVRDDRTGRHSDPNQPHVDFFEPTFQSLRRLAGGGKPPEVLHQLWEKFLLEGTPALKSERDDKTMLFAFLLQPSP